MATPNLRVFGSCAWLPRAGNDGSWYLLDDAILIDTGWRGVTSLIDADLDATRYPVQLFTHMHPDHRLALPQLMMYWRIRRGTQGLRALTLAGPAGELEKCYRDAKAFLFSTSDEREVADCTLLPLRSDDVCRLPGHIVRTTSALHAVPGLSYRITNEETGRVVCFSGDTAYQDKYAEFFRGADLLVCESTKRDAEVPPERRPLVGHSSVYDAIAMAKAAGVRRLLLTHRSVHHPHALSIARAALDIPVDFAEPGMVVAY